MPSIKKVQAEVNKVSPYGSTPLQATVHSNDNEGVALLLKKKADPNITEKPTGETALHRAILNKNIHIVTMLLEAGANVDVMGLYGSALHLAAARDIQIVEALLKHKANSWIQNKEKKPPVFVAAFAKRYDIVRVLVDNNADINVPISDNGDTLLHFAIRKEKPDIPLDLLQMDIGAEPNGKNSKGETMLHLCSKSPEVFESLLKSKCDPNIQDVEGNTPLHASIELGWDFTKLLLDYNANMEISNNSDITPLLQAGCQSRKRMQEMIEHTKFTLTNKKGRHFVRVFTDLPTAKQENKDWLTEQIETAKKATAKKRRHAPKNKNESGK